MECVKMEMEDKINQLVVVKVDEIKMEVDVKIDQLVEKTNKMDQKIDFILEKSKI